MAKPDFVTADDLAGVVIKLNKRIDGLNTRLRVCERHLVNPGAHQQAHAELREVMANYAVELPPRDDVYGMFDQADVDALYAKIRATPGHHDANGVCVTHERAIERLGTIFKHMGWA